MYLIIIGKISGIILPFIINKTMKFQADSTGEKNLTYLLFLILFSFVEYQLYTSVIYGRLYNRGTIEKCEGFKFTFCQFSYAFLAGFMIAIFFQNIFKITLIAG